MVSPVEPNSGGVLLPGESGPHRPTEAAAASPSAGGYNPPQAAGSPGARGGPVAAGAAAEATLSVERYARRVVDDTFQWFAFNQPLRGDHFGITSILLDRSTREQSDTASKELLEGGYACEGGGEGEGGGTASGGTTTWRGGPPHADWLDYVRDNPDVGLFTIAYMHDGPRPFVKYYVKTLLYLIIWAQLLIPFLFWLYRASFRDIVGGEVCPATAPFASRMMSVSVALIYFVKINFVTMEKLARGGKHQALDETDAGGRLQVHVALDRHMDLVFKALVYIINLKLVFIEDSAIDILLNALAMEFILMLDGEMKDLYLRVFEVDVNSYRWANNEFGGTPIPHWQFQLIVLFSYYSWAALWLCLVVLFFALIYLPVCKL